MILHENASLLKFSAMDNTSEQAKSSRKQQKPEQEPIESEHVNDIFPS